MAMDDVIQSILDIDKEASDKLAEAEKNKLDAIKKATTERNQMILDAEKSAEDEIRQIEKNEAEKAETRIRELKEEEVRRISEMKESFEKNSAVWQEEIFRKVISGSAD